MLRFLRLFSAFRSLEARLEQVEYEQRQSHEREESLRSELSEARAEISALHKRIEDDTRNVADVMAMRAGVGRLFSKAESVPAAAIQNVSHPTGGRQFARALQVEQAKKTMSELEELWAGLGKSD